MAAFSTAASAVSFAAHGTSEHIPAAVDAVPDVSQACSPPTASARAAYTTPARISGPLLRLDALAALSPRPTTVVLMCGIAGSGKTTFSQELEGRGFARLSIDEIIWNTAGRFGLDYTPETYSEHLNAARGALKAEALRLLEQSRPFVIDSAFWSRAHRDEYVALISKAGGHPTIVYLKATKELLQKRLEGRRSRFDANANRPIDDALLNQFLAGFEEPSAEENPLVVIQEN